MIYNYEGMSHLPGFTTAMTILIIMDVLLALAVIFMERKDPSATLAWVLILALVPIGGIILYFIFSQNIARKKIFRLTTNEELLLTNSLTKQNKAIAEGEYDFSNQEGRKWRNLIRLNQVYGRAYYTQDNDMDLFTDGKDMFYNLIKDIEAAKSSVNVLYFIIKDDYVGNILISTLPKKAREGVEVRLLVDALGSRHMTKKRLEDFLEAGGSFAAFFPSRFKLFNLINPKINYRNHRKLVTIDHKMGYIGGYNIAKEYLGEEKKFGNWRDTHIRLRGSCVQDLNGRFLLDWRFASSEKVSVEEIFFTPDVVEGNTGVQIVSSGPDSPHEEVKRAFMKMITSATKNIYLQTPYFVPDAPILESLKMAAQSGVDVRVMIPCKPDHIFVYWATYSYVGEILKSGARVFIYDNGFLHAKTMTVDGEVATVGSTNFDRRSFKLNFEGNAFIYCKEQTKKLEDVFKNDLEYSHELTLEGYAKRSWWIKFKEPFARLLSDIL